MTHIMATESRESYLEKRKEFIQDEKRQALGGISKLSPKEERINEYLMKTKLKEILYAKNNDTMFPPATHFFLSKEKMEDSDVFKFIRKMPKGGILHIHDMAIVDLRWVIKNATYDPNCCICYTKDTDVPNFYFFPKPPSEPKEGCTPWKQVTVLRNSSKSAQEYDDQLYREMTMIVPNPNEAFKTLDEVWKRFLQLFQSMVGLYTYRPVFENFIPQAFKWFLEDRVSYVEIRTLLNPIYELDGTQYDKDWQMGTLKKLIDKFAKENRDFIGAKIIFTSIRAFSDTVISQDVKDAVQLVSKYPDTLAGYDLVGQEDPNHTLKYYLDALLYPAQHNKSLRYFFHAGETDWQGLGVDENVIDAVLLNTTRIGHGYAVAKHPRVLEAIKQKSIALEVNPISNQVLKLVDDLRNHPMSALLAQDYPIVVSSDDPALWGALPLSHDFYEAFMGLGGAWADLRMLKQLAVNSLKYSAMTDTERLRAMVIWEKQWDAFIDQTLSDIDKQTEINQIDDMIQTV